MSQVRREPAAPCAGALNAGFGGAWPAAVLFLAALAWLYWQPVYGMVLEWYSNENYSHGFLIPIISGYLVWERREKVADALRQGTPWNWGLLVLGAGLVLFFVGRVAGETFTMRISLLVVLAGTLLFSFGIAPFRSIGFPFAYLFFMVPLPFIVYDSLALPLKFAVTKYSVAILKLVGIPVLREGNVITLVNTTLEVADACSGMRSIVSLLALAAALAYFTQKEWWRRGVLVLLAIPIAVLANGVRVVGTGILAVRFGSGVAEGFFHEFAGLVIFSVAMAMLMLAAYLLGKGANSHES